MDTSPTHAVASRRLHQVAGTAPLTVDSCGDWEVVRPLQQFELQLLVRTKGSTMPELLEALQAQAEQLQLVVRAPQGVAGAQTHFLA